MAKKVLLLVVSLHLLLTAKILAQDSISYQPKNKIGFVTGAGAQYTGQLIGAGSHGFAVATNYYYHVRFYELQYYHTLKRKKHSEWNLLIQPQYNVTRYGLYPESVAADYLDSYELGLNLGFLYNQTLSNGPLSWYLSLSTGPHYSTGTPHRQISGFMFSNNLFAGLNLKVYKSLYLDTRFGLRHMSNAGTRLPNAGVNNVMLKEGFLIAFK